MKKPVDRHRKPRSDAEFEQLLQAAGRRVVAPAEDLTQIKAEAHIAWLRMVAAERDRRRWYRSRRVLALAATLVLVMATAWWWAARPDGAPVVAVATVERLSGEVRLAEGNSSLPLTPNIGGSLAAGAELETARAGADLALRLPAGQSVRLAAGSRVVLGVAGRLELKRGTLYVDSGRVTTGRQSVEIVTPAGIVRDIGTQFEVQLRAGRVALRVRVREGEISLSRDGETHSAVAGEELRLDVAGGVDRGQVAAAGAIWDWVQAAAPRLDIEGVTLAAYLEWVVRETGWQLEYASEALAAKAHGIIIHGTIGDATPGESIDLALPSSRVGYRVVDGKLMITDA